MSSIQEIVDNTLVQYLATMRHVRCPSDILIQLVPVEPLRPGEISFTQNGFVLPSQGVNLACLEIQKLGIPITRPVQDLHKADVKFILMRKQQAPLSKFASHWYVDLFVKKSQAHPAVKQLIENLNNESKQAGARFIFRGEYSMFPSVSSTLARHWATNNANAVRLISERYFSSCLTYLQDIKFDQSDSPKLQSRHKLGVMALLQHFGGVTNLIDFSTEIWVALFFACTRSMKPSTEANVSDNTGRIWKLDQGKPYNDLEIHQLSSLSDLYSNQRWEHQSGVVVISDTGSIPASYLKEVARIPEEYKSQLGDFLRLIGISIPTMYNDIEGYIRFEQDSISLEALCHMMLDWLCVEEYDRVLNASEVLIAKDDMISNAAGYYFRGLLHAIDGQLLQARSDIKQFCAMIPGDTPDYAQANLHVVQDALNLNHNRNLGKKQKRKLQGVKNRLCMSFRALRRIRHDKRVNWRGTLVLRPGNISA